RPTRAHHAPEPSSRGGSGLRQVHRPRRPPPHQPARRCPRRPCRDRARFGDGMRRPHDPGSRRGDRHDRSPREDAQARAARPGPDRRGTGHPPLLEPRRGGGLVAGHRRHALRARDGHLRHLPAAVRLTPGMHVFVNGVRLFFDVEGASLVPDGPAMREKPTLVLLHGGPGFDHSIYKPAFSALSDIAQVVFLDHRGNGRSEPGRRESWTLAQWADDVHAFCETLGIARPIVYGASFGGTVALAYATRHPAHPAKLILVSTEAAGAGSAGGAVRALRGTR